MVYDPIDVCAPPENTVYQRMDERSITPGKGAILIKSTFDFMIERMMTPVEKV